MTRRSLSMIAALGPGGLIGQGGRLPWHFSEDLKHFKRLTLGHSILMGRLTFESLPGLLPRRRHLVVSRSLGNPPQGNPPQEVDYFPNLEEALEAAWEQDADPFVIGGAQLYRAALPFATQLYLTEVTGDFQGDTYFPPFDRNEWREAARIAGATPALCFLRLVRRSEVPNDSSH